MAELPAMYHEAYSYAVKIWKSLNYGDSLDDTEQAQLRNLVSRYIAHQYPAVPATARSSAVSYGISAAERDLTNPDVGGFVGTVGGAIDATVETVEGGLGEAAGAARGAIGAVERAVRGVLAEILRAVPLPRAALPAKVPTQLTQAHATLARQVGTLTPTALGNANKTRAAMRRLGR